MVHMPPMNSEGSISTAMIWGVSCGWRGHNQAACHGGSCRSSQTSLGHRGRLDKNKELVIKLIIARTFLDKGLGLIRMRLPA
jgi:hypothetical protein